MRHRREHGRTEALRGGRIAGLALLLGVVGLLTPACDALVGVATF